MGKWGKKLKRNYRGSSDRWERGDHRKATTPLLGILEPQISRNADDANKDERGKDHIQKAWMMTTRCQG